MAVKDGEAPKLHHVTSETTAEAFATAAAGPAAAEAFAAAAAGPWMGKHHGSEGRRSPKIAPRNF